MPHDLMSAANAYDLTIGEFLVFMFQRGIFKRPRHLRGPADKWSPHAMLSFAIQNVESDIDRLSEMAAKGARTSVDKKRKAFDAMLSAMKDRRRMYEH